MLCLGQYRYPDFNQKPWTYLLLREGGVGEGALQRGGGSIGKDGCGFLEGFGWPSLSSWKLKMKEWWEVLSPVIWLSHIQSIWVSFCGPLWFTHWVYVILNNSFYSAANISHCQLLHLVFKTSKRNLNSRDFSFFFFEPVDLISSLLIYENKKCDIGHG